jgi:general secretion pathway protein K
MIVIVDGGLMCSLKNSQSGVALLQVLLISTVISLLAIRFAETSREQIEIAAQIELRTKAQLRALSVQNEVLFVLLSDSVTPIYAGGEEPLQLLPSKLVINRHGAAIDWAEGVRVKIQDLNGLLPQMFPTHDLWRDLLNRSNLDESSINGFLGGWADMQDSDLRDWRGGVEPAMTPSGQTYINGYAQNDYVVKQVFRDHPDLLKLILNVSSVHASYETSLYNAPDSLVDAILEKDVADALILERRDGVRLSSSIAYLLRNKFPQENIYLHDSNRLRVSVLVDLPLGSYDLSQTILLESLSKPPFRIIGRN